MLGSKALGALHLDELLADVPLDVYLPVSSLASQVPTVGQLDYAAANAVLDALAQNRADRGEGLACALGWGPWQEVGIAVDHLREVLDAGDAREAARAADEPLDHPVLRARSRTAGGWTYRGELHPGLWVVDDHRLDGRPILSGTTTIQLVKTAFERHAPAPGAIEMTDVVFHRPLFTAERGTSIELRFASADGDERFELASRPVDADEPWIVNASGYVRRSDVAPRAAGRPPTRAQWSETARARGFGAMHLSGGPRWGWRRWERQHEGATWSRVELPPAFEGDFATWDLHPAMLDAATQGARGTDGEVVPHTYDVIRVHAPLEGEIFAANTMRRVGAAAVNDVVVTDAHGRVLVELEGLVLRAIAGSALAGPAARADRRDTEARSRRPPGRGGGTGESRFVAHRVLRAAAARSRRGPDRGTRRGAQLPRSPDRARADAAGRAGRLRAGRRGERGRARGRRGRRPCRGRRSGGGDRARRARDARDRAGARGRRDADEPGLRARARACRSSSSPRSTRSNRSRASSAASAC